MTGLVECRAIPRGLMQSHGRAYLIASCHVAGIEKTYRLDRIREYLPTPTRFGKPYSSSQCAREIARGFGSGNLTRHRRHVTKHTQFAITISITPNGRNLNEPQEWRSG